MFKSPLVLPLTLIFAGALALMAILGIIPAEFLRLWPIIFVVLGFVGLVSLSSEELAADLGTSKKAKAKPAVKAVKAPAKKVAAKKVATKSTKKTTRKR